MPVTTVRWVFLMPLLLLWGSEALAADVYGRVWVAAGKNNTPLAHASVFVACNDSEQSGTTDGSGNYRIPASGNGNCWIRVTAGSGKNSNRIRVLVSSSGTRADLELTESGDRWSVTLR
ncbi:MAG TPA: carboxypeptidase-like regulatory domain-containing protein [Vicinamibacterales bacterium]|nr:carboxypeptidase-like regulatory domain-containing protein [Vicinamibacterales bacterium]